MTRANKWQGSGEQQVRLPISVTESIYKKDISLSIMNNLAKNLCQHFGLGIPLIMVSFEKTKNKWGTYKNNTITLYRTWIGVFIHELSHYIVRNRYPLQTKSHGKEFGYVCSMLWQMAIKALDK